MALSNRDRVGRAFESLAAGLAPYIDRRMRAASHAGVDWLRAWATASRPPVHGEASLADPALQLRVLTESWDGVFRHELTRSDRNLVFELRDIRNRWAHNGPVSADDAYRALDSVERLLTAIDAREADEVGRAKAALRVKLGSPVAEALLMAPAAGLRPWRDVISPHDDVARGRFALAEFAADLHQVALGEGAAEYTDPAGFFARTFVTAGLGQLLAQAVERLHGAGGVPVVDLQTTFGGGKTHSMIALYHLFSGTPLDRFPQEVQDLVGAAGAAELPAVRRAVLVGTRIAPGQAVVKADGTEVGTLWGELAWQLGGADGFALVAEADRTRSNPGDALRAVLKQAAPCLVLIDEWVAYARGLYADDTLRAGTFDTHFSFAQALTEAVRGVQRALLVVSIPASGTPEEGPPVGSEVEVGGAGGREALRRLRAVVGRMESSWRPASAEESFEIVRRRLFQPIDSSHLADRDATAAAVGDLYRRESSEFPPECREPAYVRRVQQAYPIHPELFARLYEDWSTLDRFQRTRGVLRLMATVIHALWASGDQSPLILPASVPLADSAVAAELTRNLDDSWKPIIDADVDGPDSLPRSLDDQFKSLGRYLAARRVARAVFLGSAPRVGSSNPGIDVTRVRLGCALPGESTAIYGDALNRLADRATYLYVGAGRYWYGTRPSVARIARDRAARLLDGERAEVRDAVVARLRGLERERGDFAAVHVLRRADEEVADVAEARLVVLGPELTHSARSEASEAVAAAMATLRSRGAAPRTYGNMLVFLAPDQRRIDDLEQAVAELRAWSSVVAEALALNLDPHQKAQAEDRAADAERTVGLRLADAYSWLLIPRQDEPPEDEPTGPVEWESIRVEGPGGLAERAGRKLVQGGQLYLRYPPVLLRLQLDGPLAALWESGDASLVHVWEAYARYLYLHRLRDIDVLTTCVMEAPASITWASDGLAVAQAHDSRTGRYLGLQAGEHASSVLGSTLLVRPERAIAQRDTEQAVPAAEPDGDKAGGTTQPDSPGLPRRFYGVVAADSARFGRDAGRVAQEVLAHLNGLVGTQLDVTIEIRATNEDGFPDHVTRIVSENAAALRFKFQEFEER